MAARPKGRPQLFGASLEKCKMQKAKWKMQNPFQQLPVLPIHAASQFTGNCLPAGPSSQLAISLSLQTN